MIAYALTAALALAQAASPSPAASTSPAPSPAPAAVSARQAVPELAVEVKRGWTRAYNAQDIGYFQASLAPDAVYIADDGAVVAGRERIVELFTGIFARTPKPRLEIRHVRTSRRGDVAWARFDWKLSRIEKARPGVAIAVFALEGDKWQVVSIQNTGRGHGMRAASPSPGASPAPHKH